MPQLGHALLPLALALLACGPAEEAPEPPTAAPSEAPPTALEHERDDAPDHAPDPELVPVPESDPNSRPAVPPPETGGWSEPGPAASGDPCPADMAFVPAGRFTSGSTAAQAGMSPDWPDKEFFPRPREQRGTEAFCIDLYEYPNVRGEKPWVYVGWAQAKQACALRGRRLCAEDEWAKACGGDEGWLFPYGDVHEPKRCNDSVDPVGDESQKSAAGAFPDCVSPYGVYDMDGNVSEWVDAVHQLDPERSRVIRGGTMWVAVYGHGCPSRHTHHELGPTHGDDGFRCCMDPLNAATAP